MPGFTVSMPIPLTASAPSFCTTTAAPDGGKVNEHRGLPAGLADRERSAILRAVAVEVAACDQVAVR
jgi:hypothetical protein